MQSVHRGFKQSARDVLAFNIKTVGQMIQRLKKRKKKRRLFPRESFKGAASIF